MVVLDLYPKTSGKLTIKKNRNNYFVRDRAIKKDLIINEDLALILRECSGQKSVKKIGDIVSERKKIPRGGIIGKLENSLKNLEQDNIIEFSKEIDPTPIRYRETNFNFPLDTAYLEITKKCNFPCIHCFLGSPSFTRQISKEEMTLEDYRDVVIPSLDSAGVLGACITGGEPFLRKDSVDIMDLLDKANIDFGILTNGYFINNRTIDHLKRLQPRFIGISFDSHEKEIFEQIRGKNRYKRVLQAIEGLNDANLNPNINCILFKGLNNSYQHIYNFIKFLDKKGISPHQITFDELVPEGEGKNLYKYLINEKETVKDISTAFREASMVDFGEIKKPEYKTKMSRSSFCGLGQEIIYIGSKGDISLCPALSGERYIAGNILRDNFTDIWENSIVFEPFRKLDLFKNSACSSCNMLKDCLGGCRAKSMTFSGNFKSIDPWMCAFYKRGSKNNESKI